MPKRHVFLNDDIALRGFELMIVSCYYQSEIWMMNGDCQFTLKSSAFYSFADDGFAKTYTFKRHPKT